MSAAKGHVYVLIPGLAAGLTTRIVSATAPVRGGVRKRAERATLEVEISGIPITAADTEDHPDYEGCCRWTPEASERLRTMLPEAILGVDPVRDIDPGMWWQRSGTATITVRVEVGDLPGSG